MKYKLTKTQINFFWKRAYYWIEYWGLDKQWQIHTKNDADDKCDFYAAVSTSAGDGLAMIYLCTSWDVQPNNRALDRHAFHESLHLLLAPLDKADSNDLTLEHQIIRTLENTVWNTISEYAEENI